LLLTIVRSITGGGSQLTTITFVADPDSALAGAQTATQKAGLLATGATISISQLGVEFSKS
jgi:hypothetical protein